MAQQNLANVPETDRASAFEQAERQRKTWDGLNALIRRHHGWIVTPPGRKIRFQCYQANTKIAPALERIGFKAVFLGQRERVNSSGISHVHEYEVTIPVR